MGDRFIYGDQPKGFTVMGNYHLRDKNLSNKARGLLSTMMSLPPDWNYTSKGLACICKDGLDGIAAQLKELEELGYLHRKMIRGEHGRLDHIEYTFFGTPHPVSLKREFPVRENPVKENPVREKPCRENPVQINKDRSKEQKEKNTDLTNHSRKGSDLSSEKEEKQQFEDVIQANIKTDRLMVERPFDAGRIIMIQWAMVNTLASNEETVHIGKDLVPMQKARELLLSVRYQHVMHVLESMSSLTPEQEVSRPIILAALIKAVTKTNT